MKRKLEVWQPLLYSLVLIAGMYIGYRFSKSQPETGFFEQTEGSSLQEALDIIKLKYVDPVRIDTLQSNAIREMMNELDPHSVYLPPIDLKETNEDLSGNFQGIGVEFNLTRDTVNVTYVIKGGPSDVAGIHIGDQILKVNDIALTGMNSAKIKNAIRGERGSKALLQILRNNSLQTITVVRGNIPTPSVVAAYMIDKVTAYLKLDKFSSTSYREFMENMDSLKKLGMKDLIFDLRGNGGGYMEQAVEIADEFLDGDKLIVYTEGTNSAKREYRCKRPGIFEQGKLAILVDGLSASASEIVAGALQDWDRATIIGRRTFGKGLVQEIFELSDGAALKLTVSRYYTPLGRSIQKSYAAGKKVYMDEVWERYANGQAFFADSNKINVGKKYITHSGRELYGNGGIMPDIFVGMDTTRASRDINKLYFNGSFNDFVLHYYLDNKSLLSPYKSVSEYARNFEPSKEMWQKFVTWSQKDSVNLSVIPALEKGKVEDRMKAYLARFRWRDNGYYEVLNTKDSAVQKAIKILEAK